MIRRKTNISDHPEKRTPEEDFDYFVRNPLEWLNNGVTLHKAAMHLFGQYREAYESLGTLDGAPMDEAAFAFVDADLFKPAGMLAGYALEVTIKAAIVAKYASRITFDTKPRKWWNLKKKTSGHDLVHLVREAGLDGVDEDFLSKLTQFSVWKGRYPSSLEGKPMYGTQSELEHYAGSHWLVLVDQFDQAFSTIYDQSKAVIKECRYMPD